MGPLLTWPGGGSHHKEPPGAGSICSLGSADVQDSSASLSGNLPPTHSQKVPGEYTHGWQSRLQPSLTSGRCLAGQGGEQRTELTRGRHGQSEARNGTFPPGVSCQLVREHGTVAKGAAALCRGREKNRTSKPFSLPQKAIFKRL